MVRQASVADVPEIKELIQRSVRTLQAADYSPQQIEGALATVYGVDTQLIKDGSFFVAELIGEENRVKKNTEASRIIACGGWSKRRTLCGSDEFVDRDDTLLKPETDAAKIRAFFIDPEFARRGLGSTLLQKCEESAMAEGFTRFEMGSTLTGTYLYQRHGYKPIENISIALNNGAELPIVRMTKTIEPD